MISHILVGVDGAEASQHAARFALDLAKQTSSRVTLLFVLEPPRLLPLGPLDSFVEIRGSDREHIEAGHRMLDDIATAFSPQEVRIDRLVEVGHAADTLCDQAEKLGADLIVVGARGPRPGRWLLGSVSDRVVHHAKRAVAVVR
jgi:nucleotide-binding universal stress UspA family protein